MGRLSQSIAECKRRLPLPELWSRLGLPGDPKRSMRSPFRQDRTPSFSVFEIGNQWFYKDHATAEGGDEISLIQRHTGCTKEDAIKFYHELAGVPLPRKSRKQQRASLGKLVKTYDYLDARGQLVHQTVRYDPKQFLQRRPAAKGMRAGNKTAKCDLHGSWWLWTLAGIEPVLYRLPEILAHPQKPVVLCEGEKDADALAATGAIATTVPMGAGKWRQSYSETLRERDVVVAADRDPIGSTEAGQNHALLVARHLLGYANSVLILDWNHLWPEAAKDPTRKLDISLWLESRNQNT